MLFQGRRGLGNIYVWASGDGGEEDDCNCDGYAASMWTVSINSAINNGENAHYDESCSSTLASTFSNGAKDPHTGVVSTQRSAVFQLCNDLAYKDGLEVRSTSRRIMTDGKFYWFEPFTAIAFWMGFVRDVLYIYIYIPGRSIWKRMKR